MSRKRNEQPSAADFGKFRAWLAQNGASQAEVNEALGTRVDGRSRDEIVTGLQVWLKNRSS